MTARTHTYYLQVLPFEGEPGRWVEYRSTAPHGNAARHEYAAKHGIPVSRVIDQSGGGNEERLAGAYA